MNELTDTKLESEIKNLDGQQNLAFCLAVEKLMMKHRISYVQLADNPRL